MASRVAPAGHANRHEIGTVVRPQGQMWRQHNRKEQSQRAALMLKAVSLFARRIAVNREERMTEHQETPPIYARPADRSLAAYKDFIHSIMAVVNPSAPDDKDEQWWQEAWQEFWGAADAARENTSLK